MVSSYKLLSTSKLEITNYKFCKIKAFKRASLQLVDVKL